MRTSTVALTSLSKNLFKFVFILGGAGGESWLFYQRANNNNNNIIIIIGI